MGEVYKEKIIDMVEKIQSVRVLEIIYNCILNVTK